MNYLLGLIGFFATFLIWGLCQADMVSVQVTTAELRSNPSLNSSYVLMEVPLNFPLFVQGEQDDFYEVSDYLGHVGWIEKQVVSNQRGIVIEANNVNIRKGPGTQFPVIFKASRGVAFKVAGEKKGWLEVIHESGHRGWVSQPLTWGY